VSGRSDRSSAPSTAPTARTRLPARIDTPSATRAPATVAPSTARTGTDPTPSAAVQR
jgi:hypothetical protein